MTRGAILTEIARSKLRRLLARKKSLGRTDVRAAGRKSAPKWRGPAAVLGKDDNRVSVKFQGDTFKVSRRYVRKRVDPGSGLDTERDARPSFSSDRGAAGNTRPAIGKYSPQVASAPVSTPASGVDSGSQMASSAALSVHLPSSTSLSG